MAVIIKKRVKTDTSGMTLGEQIRGDTKEYVESKPYVKSITKKEPITVSEAEKRFSSAKKRLASGEISYKQAKAEIADLSGTPLINDKPKKEVVSKAHGVIGGKEVGGAGIGARGGNYVTIQSIGQPVPPQSEPLFISIPGGIEPYVPTPAAPGATRGDLVTKYTPVKKPTILPKLSTGSFAQQTLAIKPGKTEERSIIGNILEGIVEPITGMFEIAKTKAKSDISIARALIETPPKGSTRTEQRDIAYKEFEKELAKVRATPSGQAAKRFSTSFVIGQAVGAGTQIVGAGLGTLASGGGATLTKILPSGAEIALQPLGARIGQATASLIGKTEPFIQTGLLGAAAGVTGYRIAKEPKGQRAKKAGEILGSEIIPSVLGAGVGMAGGRLAIDVQRTAGLEEIPIERLTPKEVLSGRKTFPEAPRESQLGIFQSSPGRLPGETRPAAFHATAMDIKTPTEALPGKKEFLGLYVSPYVSPQFTRVSGETPGLVGGELFPKAKPTILRITPTQIRESSYEYVGKRVVEDKGKTRLQKTYEFTTPTQKGEAIIPKLKTEIEAIIPEKTPLQPTAERFFTEYKGRRIPIREYKTLGEPSVKTTGSRGKARTFKEVVSESGKPSRDYIISPSSQIGSLISAMPSQGRPNRIAPLRETRVGVPSPRRPTPPTRPSPISPIAPTRRSIAVSSIISSGRPGKPVAPPSYAAVSLSSIAPSKPTGRGRKPKVKRGKEKNTDIFGLPGAIEKESITPSVESAFFGIKGKAISKELARAGFMRPIKI